MKRLVVIAVPLLFACGGGAEASSAPKDPSSEATVASATPAAAERDAGATEATTASNDAGASATTESPRRAPAEPPTKIGARHVLIQWMGSERAPTSILRTREQALALAKEVLKRARAGEDLGRLAVEYSDEPNAGGRGGSLGRFGHGQMVPAFEAAAFQLDVGQVSDIVETPFGFHVIQRTE